MDPGFWVPRLADKIVMSALIIVTYYGVGDNRDPLNTNNIAAALFLIVVLPMFSAGIYTPTLVLGTSDIGLLLSYQTLVVLREGFVLS